MKTLEVVLLLTVMAHAILWSWGSTSAPPAPVQDKAAYVNPSLFEAESLAVESKSREFHLFTQSTADFVSGRWSSDGHLFVQTEKVGDWIQFVVPVSQAGVYRVIVFLTRSYDYGTVRFSVNGKPAGEKISLWSGDGQVFPTGPVILGEFELTPEKNKMRVEVVGTDPASTAPHYQFALDGIKLLPVSKSN